MHENTSKCVCNVFMSVENVYFSLFRTLVPATFKCQRHKKSYNFPIDIFLHGACLVWRVQFGHVMLKRPKRWSHPSFFWYDMNCLEFDSADFSACEIRQTRRTCPANVPNVWQKAADKFDQMPSKALQMSGEVLKVNVFAYTVTS